MPVTSADEPFEVYSATGERLGIEPRGTVHRLGLWHRSSHVFVFDQQGRLLLQQRSADKDLFPNAWDYSVGEHLQPGESYLDAAQRGLAEELGLVLTHLAPLGAPVAAEYIGSSGQLVDREFQQGYRTQLPSDLSPTAIAPDATEVAQISWLTAEQIQTRLQANAASFTPWFIRSATQFHLLR